MKKIDLYADGLLLKEFDENFGIDIDGYNEKKSILKKGATDYIGYSKKILDISKK